VALDDVEVIVTLAGLAERLKSGPGIVQMVVGGSAAGAVIEGATTGPMVADWTGITEKNANNANIILSFNMLTPGEAVQVLII